MDLWHCVYCSASAKETSNAELVTLLEECRTKNAKNGLTGILLYHKRSFFQVLEGDRTAVEALFDKIEVDPRHNRVIKIISEPIAARAFAKWTMGYPNIGFKELAEIPALNDFFMRGRSYLELGEGRAKALLAAFQEGRWRVSLR